jgi:hypothetical protein
VDESLREGKKERGERSCFCSGGEFELPRDGGAGRYDNLGFPRPRLCRAAYLGLRRVRTCSLHFDAAAKQSGRAIVTLAKPCSTLVRVLKRWEMSSFQDVG